ncbi:MAG: hypothetical protein P8X85_19335 [Desulfobacterales bacterium]
MDCQTIDKSMQNFPRAHGGTGSMSINDLKRHCAACRRCRNKYAGILDAQTHHNPGRRQSLEKHRRVAVNDAGADKIPDISEPAEFKDAPLAFTLHVNGREEEIKVVEPEIDVALPKASRLVVREKEDCLCDVVFDFNPQSSRPYELHFRVMMGVAYARDHLAAFGTDSEVDRDLAGVYRYTIVDRGGVKADIEMTGGKARLLIVYKPLQE